MKSKADSPKPIPDLFSRDFQRAVTKLKMRAEKQLDTLGRAIKESFVDANILIQIQNDRDQIILGRRGSGKTHLLLQLDDHAVEDKSLLCYIDSRRLSSGIFEAGLPTEPQATKFFRSILTKIHSFLLEELTRRDSLEDKARNKAFGCLNQMVNAIQDNSFTEYCLALENFVNAMGARHLYLLLDEWVAVPRQIQPYVASLLKKIFIPSPRVVLKVGAIGFQARFGKPLPEGGVLGFEVGADIFSDVDLDTYMVFDKDPARVEDFFARVLYRHLSLGIDLRGIDHKGLVKKCFSNTKAFLELVRACEGVSRDFLEIFSQSYFGALGQEEKLGVPIIRKAAHGWYIRDKHSNVQEEPHLERFLLAIVENVIGKKQARTFMVEQRHSRNPIVLRLFDLRLLHIIRRGYSDRDRPGVRFDIFSIDYGAYVDLVATAKKPQIDFEFMKEGGDPKVIGEDFAVPFDDLRKIRCIKLSDWFFETYTPKDLFGKRSTVEEVSES